MSVRESEVDDEDDVFALRMKIRIRKRAFFVCLWELSGGPIYVLYNINSRNTSLRTLPTSLETHQNPTATIGGGIKLGGPGKKRDERWHSSPPASQIIVTTEEERLDERESNDGGIEMGEKPMREQGRLVVA